MRRTFGLSLAVVVLVLGSPVTRAGTSFSSQTVTPVTSGTTFADLDNAPEDASGVREARRHRPAASEGSADSNAKDPSAAEPASTRAATVGVSVNGIRFTGVVPPDPVGEVGTTHYIQMTNAGGSSRVLILDKTGTSVGGGRLEELAPSGHACKNGRGDPIVLFDQLASRWLLTEFRDTPSNGVCIYVSSAADAMTSTWQLYSVNTGFFPDYPKYSVMPDAYYMSTNEPGSTVPAYAFDRTAMLAGNAATVIKANGAIKLGAFGFQALSPVDLDGSTQSPAGTRGIFVRHRDDEIHDGFPNATQDFVEIWEFDPDFTTPANSTFAKTQDVATSEFNSTLCGTFSFRCFRQKGTTQKLDPLREVVMHRPTLRAFGAHQSLVGSFVTDVGNNRGGVRWFELRRAAATTTAGWSTFQEGTLGGDGFDRWMSSLAMNGDGDIGLGYSRTSRQIFPRVDVTGRLDTDTPGTMSQGEVEVAKSRAPQTFSNRWGDYSAMSVDPSDDETFWYTNEYIGRTGRWKTRIVSYTVN
jgi:hypothetical protein